MIFNSQKELHKYILEAGLECYWSDLEQKKVYVRSTYNKSNKKILTINY